MSAVLTPPDIITQVLLGFPLYALYEFGVLVSTFFENPKNREAALKQMQLERELKKAEKEALDNQSRIKKKVKKPKKKTVGK